MKSYTWVPGGTGSKIERISALMLTVVIVTRWQEMKIIVLERNKVLELCPTEYLRVIMCRSIDFFFFLDVVVVVFVQNKPN